MGDILVPKKFQKFQCKSCDYYTNRYSQYERHLNTAKHKMVTNGDNLVQNRSDCYLCSCGKEFKYRQGLSRHKKNCNGKPSNSNETTITTGSTETLELNTSFVDVLLRQQEKHRRKY